MKPFEYIEHTADAGMRVRGNTLKSLFNNAAQGLFEMIAVVDTIDETSSIDVDIAADSVEMLFVKWLDELVFRHETDEIFFKRSDIQHIETTEFSAQVYGEPTNFDKHVVYTEIKAVTYHQLYVIQNPNGVWEAQVIFDL
ncbi:MAG: archease [Candidatus Poribacteria bacterium]|nr:archease [Candidatus Poribacteria bacterium]